MKPLFLKGPSLFARALVFGLIALFLVVADYRMGWTAPLRAAMSSIVGPLYRVVDAPAALGDWWDHTVVSRDELVRTNESLRNEVLVLRTMSQRLAVLEAENAQLRELLNSSAQVRGRLQVAELIAISPDPDYHTVVINRGSEDGVYLGQAVLDASGLMGQVVEVQTSFSRAILISDASHAIPVEVNRNGVRSVLRGLGRLDTLELLHVPATTDIQVGDILVSSGLGQRFPRGYPVATVTSVSTDPGRPFSTIAAAPTAELNRSRYVLLLFATPSVLQSEVGNGDD